MQRVFDYFSKATERRIMEISNKISDTLKEGESAVLILRDQDRIKLSLAKDIEIFLVVPSVYDDILKYLRDKFLF